MTPACAQWNIWTGPEVEGVTDRNSPTLFVRRGSSDRVRELILGFDRIWFCKEWTDWSVVRLACDSKKVVCLEAEDLSRVPADVYARVRVYLKVPVRLKPGDHVCIGPAFADEAFRIGDGVKVSPTDYAGDRRIG